MSLTPEWIYESDINPDDFYGVVYLITRLDTGRQYVGRKYLTAAAPKRKGVKRPARKDSNWRSYWGSCKPLAAEIEEFGHDAFKREIIRWCKTRADTNYAEVEEQMARDVLKATMPDGSRAYYNGNIMNRYFAAKESLSEETKAKMRQPKSEETKAKMRKPRPTAQGSMRADNTSGMACVSNTNNGRFQACYRRKYLGVYDTAEEALQVVELAKAGIVTFEPIRKTMTEYDRLDILYLHSTGMPRYKIAKEMNRSASIVSRVIRESVLPL